MITIDDLDKSALESFFITKDYKSILSPILNKTYYHYGLLLLFGQPRQIKRFFPNYVISLNKFALGKGDDRLNIELPFFKAMDSFYNYHEEFRTYKLYEFDEYLSIPLYNYPPSALRYAMLYSLCRLDYLSQKTSLNIKLSHKEISFEFYSGDSDVNRSILDLLIYLEQIDLESDILEYILRTQLANGQLIPTFTYQQNLTKITFKPREPMASLAYLGIMKNHELDGQEIFALLYTSQYDNGISKDELKKVMKWNDQEFNLHLRTMLKHGVLTEIDNKVMIPRLSLGLENLQGLSK